VLTVAKNEEVYKDHLISTVTVTGPHAPGPEVTLCCCRYRVTTISGGADYLI